MFNLMLQKIFIILIIIGTLFVVIGVARSYYSCPPNIIEYRYIPRTFKEEQDQPIPVSEIFADMFKTSTPWVASISTTKDRLTGQTNRYMINENDLNKNFVSQA